MLFVHKPSFEPIDAWGALRHGGENDLGDPSVRGKFLVLWDFDIIRREGRWHYIFHFDVRDRLECHSFAQYLGHKTVYPNDIRWRQWLGADFTIISAGVREEILKMPSDEAQTEALITGVRDFPLLHSLPPRKPGQILEVDLPPDVLVALPE